MTKKSSEPSEKSRSKPEDQTQDISGCNQPIAIVGMACRFPGAPDLPAFWRLLEAGENAVSEGVPGSGIGRWGQIFGNDPVQSEGCRFGAFVDDIEQFDNSFFRISPVEAEWLDPQQRMMLETSWQALEDAGIDPEQLRESRTGVYTGISNDEYRMLVVDSNKPAEAAGCLYALSGTNLNGASGRVSFVLGLRGPAKAVDAACASSMVSVHDAVADLQQGKADLAIAGGVQAILNGRIYELRADSMMLSPDGQCKAFDASANGYVRGEGCGVVILKRLSEAEADGDRIWAVIRGAAVNHGGASAGLTVPNTPALEQVMETALSNAGISPLEVDYLEAHGTGTEVGDPIEINAVAAIYGKGREAEHPLLIGSVKTNIGHLEPAAGVAGLIKVVLAMNQGVVPRHLHFRDPNPNLDWDRLPVRVTSIATDWPVHPHRPPFAAVSAFGISGTNAHVVVEGYGTDDGVDAWHQPAGAAQPVAVALPEPVANLSLIKEGLTTRKTRFLPLSGKSDGALRGLAHRYLSWLDELERSSGDAIDPLLADMAWTGGVGRSHFSYRAGVVFHGVESLREGLRKLETGIHTEPRAPTKVAFTYTGQAGQWVGMGQTLYASEPVVRAVLDRCDAVLREVQGASLLEILFDQAPDGLNVSPCTQAALYALECGLTALWASIGIRPNVVLGHGLGELAAAQAAGIFSLEDGLRIAAARGALIEGLQEVGAQATALDDLQAAPESIPVATPWLTLVSNVTGRVVEPGETLDAAYWRRRASEQGAANRCAETLVDLGVKIVVEIGPDTAPAWADGNVEAPFVLSSLQGSSDGAFVEAVAEAYAAGLPVSFAGLFAGETRRRISLPTYPFQRRRHWIQMPKR